MSTDVLAVRAGFSSLAGRRSENQDFVGLCDAEQLARDPRGLAFAVADGVSAGNGGRVAAELAVRAFLDGWYESDPTASVAATGGRVLGSFNAWLHDVAQRDATLRHAMSTFTALVLRGRSAHWLHAGDTRAWLLHDGQLQCLTDDHVLDAPEMRHVLKRAVGMEPSLRLDHGVQPLREHDRLMLCSDGVHCVLTPRRLRDLLLRRGAPDDDAQAIVGAALDAGSRDNATCVVIDVLGLPQSAAPELLTHYAALPILPPAEPGARLDGFQMIDQLAEGRYSVLMRAIDTARGTDVVLKFPRPRVATEATYHLAFVREAWVATHLRSPWVAEVLPLAEGRQTQLYCAMPLYRGETLEHRLTREPPLSLAEGGAIAGRLVRALASLHRAGVIHRDIKPENVLLERGDGLRLLDLGVARLPKLEEFPADAVPGTPSYMAPELFAGAPGDEASDLFALGVTLYRAFTGRYPYGEIEPFSRPRYGAPVPLSRYRPDLPAWLERLLGAAVAVDPAQRPADVLELGMQLESGLAHGEPLRLQRLSLYERDPLRFWKVVSAVLLIALIASLAMTLNSA